MKFEVGQTWLDGNNNTHKIVLVGAGTYGVHTNTGRTYTVDGVFNTRDPRDHEMNLVKLIGVPADDMVVTTPAPEADKNEIAAETLEALGWVWNGECWVEENPHPLKPVLDAAIYQAMYGKGERHGGATVPFLEQPIFHYAKMHGRGFLTGQAAKKLEEAASTRKGDAFEAEVLGAIVYAASAVIHERGAK